MKEALLRSIKRISLFHARLDLKEHDLTPALSFNRVELSVPRSVNEQLYLALISSPVTAPSQIKTLLTSFNDVSGSHYLLEFQNGSIGYLEVNKTKNHLNFIAHDKEDALQDLFLYDKVIRTHFERLLK